MFSAGDVEGVEQRVARLLVVALGVAARDEPLVAPPEVHARPVDAVAARVRAAAASTAEPIDPAGERDVHELAVGAQLGERSDEPGGDGLGERERRDQR